ncbi:unnamed protein product [Oppiella nova]|uniref:Uncharacterized protein n=1 Tax=Oppiella nova TaxID=334625 RepID=A0A7R9M5R6_9ACAR|nr:unnamed protein product [Oppiella nova]CAG2171277.1 unnamed protein product [Oppiella nova]
MFECISDEPTTGLDAFMAKNIVQVLKTMTSEGRTVICTIHQPSSQVFELFDSLLLMADGRVAFKGSIGDAKNFFSTQGLQICDNYLELSYSDITINTNENNTRGTPTINIPILGTGYKATYWRQFVTILWRSYITLIRNPQLLLDRFVMYLWLCHQITAFCMGIIFYNIGHAYSDASNIMGALISLIQSTSFPPIYYALTTLVDEQPLMFREHHNRTYAVLPYFLSTIIIQLTEINDHRGTNLSCVAMIVENN